MNELVTWFKTTTFRPEETNVVLCLVYSSLNSDVFFSPSTISCSCNHVWLCFRMKINCRKLSGRRWGTTVVLPWIAPSAQVRDEHECPPKREAKTSSLPPPHNGCCISLFLVLILLLWVVLISFLNRSCTVIHKILSFKVRASKLCVWASWMSYAYSGNWKINEVLSIYPFWKQL